MLRDGVGMAGGWAEDASLRLTRIVCPVRGQRSVEGTGRGKETTPVSSGTEDRKRMEPYSRATSAPGTAMEAPDRPWTTRSSTAATAPNVGPCRSPLVRRISVRTIRRRSANGNASRPARSTTNSPAPSSRVNRVRCSETSWSRQRSSSRRISACLFSTPRRPGLNRFRTGSSSCRTRFRKYRGFALLESTRNGNPWASR